MTQDFAQLDARLKTLERQNRRFRVAAFGLTGAIGLMGLMSVRSAMCDEVSAERFVLRDAKGQTRLTMDAYHTAPNMALRNDAGKTVAQLGVDARGEAFLSFFDASGNPRKSEAAAQPAAAPAPGCGEKASCTKKDKTIAMQ